ncbi:MAG: hypothetical protein JO112_07430 [Planctomycetes bacterium]|nr:hypothetical protein [Planctomycetota bacterium]
MQSSSSSQSMVPADWIQVLAKLQQALAQAVVETDQRQQALEAALAAVTLEPEEEEKDRRILAQVEERFLQFHSGVHQAEESAAAADAAMRASEQATREWLAAAETLRSFEKQKLLRPR